MTHRPQTFGTKPLTHWHVPKVQIELGTFVLQSASAPHWSPRHRATIKTITAQRLIYRSLKPCIEVDTYGLYLKKEIVLKLKSEYLQLKFRKCLTFYIRGGFLIRMLLTAAVVHRLISWGTLANATGANCMIHVLWAFSICSTCVPQAFWHYIKLICQFYQLINCDLITFDAFSTRIRAEPCRALTTIFKADGIRYETISIRDTSGRQYTRVHTALQPECSSTTAITREKLAFRTNDNSLKAWW